MSCWRTYTCDVLKSVDKAIVVEALKRMGLDFNDTVKTVTGRYESRTSSCDGVIMKDGKVIDMGIILNDGTGHLQLVGDFWGTGLNEVTFQDELSRAYQRINILAQAELNGWSLDETSLEEFEDGSVTFELYQYA